ncbi:MAG: DUF1232 domain-containing protein [bacterium]
MQEKIEQLKSSIPTTVNLMLLAPKFIRLLLALIRDPRVPKYLKILTAAVVVYVAQPADFLPDFVPVVGKGDDLIALFLVLIQYMRWCPEEVLHEHWLRIMGENYDVTVEMEQVMNELEPAVARRFSYLVESVQKIQEKVKSFSDK